MMNPEGTKKMVMGMWMVKKRLPGGKLIYSTELILTISNEKNGHLRRSVCRNCRGPIGCRDGQWFHLEDENGCMGNGMFWKAKPIPSGCLVVEDERKGLKP